MRADVICVESSLPARDGHSAPFASEWVTLSRQAHIDLVHQAHYFRALHERAVARAAWREAHYQKVLRQLKAQDAQREAALQDQRRDFLELAMRHPPCKAWALEWVDAIGQIYHLNAVRMQTLRDGNAMRVTRPRPPCTRPCSVWAIGASARWPTRNSARQRAWCCTAWPHWSGLTVFVDTPWVPLDNNTAERDLRGPVVGRKNFYGSGARCSGQLAATMYGVLATLGLWQINARTWLGAYLQACADNSNRAPTDLAPFLPWAMDAARLADMRAVPAGVSASGEVFDTS